MARPRFHLLATAPLMWTLFRRGGVAGALGALAGGVLVDVDHLVDYQWTRATGEKEHYLAPLHGWEFVGLAALLSLASLRAVRQASPLPDSVVAPRGRLAVALGTPWVAGLVSGLALGWMLHLVQDTLTNRPRTVAVYSALYRLRHGFRREITGWGEHTRFHAWSHRPWYTWV